MAPLKEDVSCGLPPRRGTRAVSQIGDIGPDVTQAIQDQVWGKDRVCFA